LPSPGRGKSSTTPSHPGRHRRRVSHAAATLFPELTNSPGIDPTPDSAAQSSLHQQRATTASLTKSIELNHTAIEQLIRHSKVSDSIGGASVEAAVGVTRYFLTDLHVLWTASTRKGFSLWSSIFCPKSRDRD